MHGTDGPTTARRVTVTFYAGARAAAGTATTTVDLPDGATAAHLTEALAGAHGPRLAAVLAVSTLLVAGEAADAGTVLADGAAVDVLPPFAGG